MRRARARRNWALVRHNLAKITGFTTAFDFSHLGEFKTPRETRTRRILQNVQAKDQLTRSEKLYLSLLYRASQ